ncbi:MAG: heme-binding protein [Pseudomonadota bacterium]
MRFVILCAAALALLPMSAGAEEEPAHTVLLEDGRYEIRQYEPAIVAQVEVAGDLGDASNAGFRKLAGYIFGGNTAHTKIEMTAPVTREASVKIDMTAPVTREPTETGTWTVNFFMPSTWTMETLPVPDDPGVTLTEVPGEMLAIHRFSGFGREGTFENKEERLRAWIAEQGYAPTGPARYAGYDAPWTPPPFRRNEVMIPVTSAGE